MGPQITPAFRPPSKLPGGPPTHVQPCQPSTHRAETQIPGPTQHYPRPSLTVTSAAATSALHHRVAYSPNEPQHGQSSTRGKQQSSSREQTQREVSTRVTADQATDTGLAGPVAPGQHSPSSAVPIARPQLQEKLLVMAPVPQTQKGDQVPTLTTHSEVQGDTFGPGQQPTILLAANQAPAPATARKSDTHHADLAHHAKLRGLDSPRQ